MPLVQHDPCDLTCITDPNLHPKGVHTKNIDSLIYCMFAYVFQHERFLHDGKLSPCDVLFIGDSIIRNMKETEVCICR